MKSFDRSSYRGMQLKTEVSAVSMVQWLSQMSVMMITDSGFLILYPSESGFLKLLAQAQGGKVGYSKGQKEEEVRPIFPVLCCH